jgi:hypothetical protein
MITNVYLLIYFIIILIAYYLNKKNINLFILKALIITFLTNDLIRIITIDLNKNIFLFFLKDIILIILLFIIFLLIKKNKVIFNKKNIFFSLIFFIIVLFSYSLSISYNNLLLLISGSYDLLFYPFLILIVIFLVKKISDLDNLEKFFLILNIVLLSILFVQLFDHNLFLKLILNTRDTDNFENYSYEFHRIKNLMFQGKYSTSENKIDIIVPSIIFSNPGRYGHYILANFLINLFFFVRKKSYINIFSLLISFTLVIFSSQRASIYLSFLVLIFCFLNKQNLLFFMKRLNIYRKSIFIFCAMLAICIVFINFYNFNLYYKFSKKIYNIYEPITNSFNKKYEDTPASFKGRLLITSNDLYDLYLKKEINTVQILFGNGFGTHSLGTKTLVKKLFNEDYEPYKHFFYEQHISTILYDVGLFGLLLYCSFFLYLNFFIQKKLKQKKLPKGIRKFIFITTITPIILLNTGYQFTHDYIFQFFYYLLIGLILVSIKITKKNVRY